MMNDGFLRSATWSMAVLLMTLSAATAQDRIYNMDRPATCGQDIVVFDKSVTINGKSDAAPTNPPLECIVYLKSGYTESDGKYRLQIIVKAILIRDCDVHVDVFNGRGAFGSYLRSLGCNSMSTDTLLTQGREATIRFTRPSVLYHTGYNFVFEIKTFRDKDEAGFWGGTNRLPPGAIIAIVLAMVALFVVGILLIWCYKSGRIGKDFRNRKYEEEDVNSVTKTESLGSINAGARMEKSESLGSAIDYNDPGVWNSVTNGQPKKLGRNFYQQNNRYGQYDPNYQKNHLYRNENVGYGYGHQNGNRMQDDAYEPYERDNNVNLRLDNKNSGNAAEWKKSENEFQRNENKRASTGSRGKSGEVEEETLKRDYGTRGSRGSKGSPSAKRASFKGLGDEETDVKHLPDDDPENDKSGYDAFTRDAPGDGLLRSSDRGSKRGSKREKDMTRPGETPSDPKTNTDKDKQFFPDEEGLQNVDLQSEADSEMVGDPANANLTGASAPGHKDSPSAKKRKKKPGKGDALPPEAQEPVFTADTGHDPSASLPYTSFGVPSYDAMYPNQYGAPYGMMPMGNFVPMPGQTYAYYQVGPIPGAGPSGMPGDPQPVAAAQAAWYVQDTPQGPVQKGFVVTSESPKKKHRGDGSRHPGGPDYTSTPANALTPKRGRGRRGEDPIDPTDISVIAAGGPPPEPGAGQRSMVMKTGVDPNNGMHVNQVMWRDTIVDPTDPPPDANPQITRKTLTRITTRSGHGNLPTNQDPMPYDDYSDRLGIEAETPAFLSPSRGTPALPPAAATPDANNVDFYLGQGRPGVQPMIIHESSSKNKVFRDRISLEDSTA